MHNPSPMSDSVTLVTGAAFGIGRATAQGFAAQGAAGAPKRRASVGLTLR